MKRKCAILLADTVSRQMGGKKPDALCQVLFQPMVRWVYENCTGAGIEDICVTAGEVSEDVQRELPEGASIAGEAGQNAGNGLLCAKAFLAEHRDADVLAVSGTAPFLLPELLEMALCLHEEQGNDATAVTTVEEDEDGRREVCAGACWFRGERLLEALDLLAGTTAGATPEAALEALKGAGAKIGSCLAEDPLAAVRGEDRRQLAALNEAARQMVFDRLWDAGVDIPVTDGVIIDPRARIGAGTRILPGTIIRGASVIGEDAVIGPGSWVEDSVIGDGCVVNATYLIGAQLEADVQIGPFCRVRPGSRLGAGVRIGNFVEVKNAVMGPGTKSAHLTYIGDADVGARVNFGCGVCIANYDGVHKHRTTIGDDCFIGCNTNLVAPVTLGDGAYTAAGTTVTEDVPEDALCIGRSRQTVLPGRAREHQKHPRK